MFTFVRAFLSLSNSFLLAYKRVCKLVTPYALKLFICTTFDVLCQYIDLAINGAISIRSFG